MIFMELQHEDFYKVLFLHNLKAGSSVNVDAYNAVFIYNYRFPHLHIN